MGITHNCIIKKADKNAWLNMAHLFQDYNYRQSWEFGIACAERLGATSEHIFISDDNQNIIALADVRIKKIPLVGGGVAYINGGPIWVRHSNVKEELFVSVIDKLIKEYVLRRKLTLRIAPPLQDDMRNDYIANILLDTGFRDIGKKKKTILLDLSLDLKKINQNLHKTWRRNLNKAKKNNIALYIGSDTYLFQKFIPLYNSMKNKKSFFVDIGIDLYEKVHDQSENIEKFIITIAEIDGHPIAGHVASILGDTCVYLLGASIEAGRNLNASYLLHWHVIEMAKASGCRWYDLGGIDQNTNPGVYVFKKRIGGFEIDYPGPFELKSAGLQGLLAQLGEKTYKSLKPYLVRE